eukprot:3874135-Rhodomonas_salina.2
MHEMDLKSGEWMDDDALLEAAMPPASPRTSTADIVLDNEETVELGPKLTKSALTARETRSKSRGTTSGELTGNSDPVRSLQELAESALQQARDDNSNVSREEAS